MKKTRALIILAALCCITSAVAASVGPPQTSASTSQIWEFSTNANPSAPTTATNPYGAPLATIDFGNESATGWNDSLAEIYGSRQGWWDIGTGSISLTIPNRITTDPLSYKDIRIEITYWKEPSRFGTISISPNATQVGTYESSLVEAGPLLGGWWTVVSNWHIEPNPNSETITITADQDWGTMIDRISVDTVCVAQPVPEPGSLMTLAAGVMGMAGLAFRKRS